MPLTVDEKPTELQDSIEQLLLIVKTAIVQLVQRSDFKQVSPDVPITKSRPKDKVDDPQKFEGRVRIRELLVYRTDTFPQKKANGNLLRISY